MARTQNRKQRIGFVLVAVLLCGFGFYWFGFRAAAFSDSQLQQLTYIRSEIDAREQRRRDGKVLPGDEAIGRVHAVLADGMLSLSDLDIIFEELKKPLPISDAFYEFKKGAEPDRVRVERAVNIGFRGVAEASLAVWFEKSLPVEAGVRERLVAHFLDVQAHSKEAMERQGAFVNLNVMGALSDKTVRDKAVSMLESETDAGAQSFGRAWKNAEAESLKQRANDVKGKP